MWERINSIFNSLHIQYHKLLSLLEVKVSNYNNLPCF
uniref:Uncharacterized protein n=1 Tax=Manihot esculenta TaxID=3983 RepID=A0A2C9V9T8_MANES